MSRSTVRGQWSNDLPALGGSSLAAVQTWQNGGSINLGVSSPGALLALGDNVALHVDAGAWLQSTGKPSSPDPAGAITLNDSALNGGIARRQQPQHRRLRRQRVERRYLQSDGTTAQYRA